MNNKDFDDALRRKLESVNYEHISNADVENVMLHINANRQAASKKNRRFVMFATVLITFILGLVGLNMYQLKDRQLLSNQIDSLHKNIAQINATLKHDAFAVLHKNNTIQKPGKNRDVVPNLKTITEYPQSSKNRLVGPDLASVYNDSKFPITNKKVTSSFPNIIDFENKITLQQDIGDNEITNAKEELPLLMITENNFSSTHDSDVASINTVTTNVGDTVDAGTVITPEKTSSLLNNLSFQVGVATDFSPRNYSFGLFARLNLNRSFSIQGGLKKSSYIMKKFHNEEDFRDGQSEDFKEKYALSNTDTQRVIDINIQYNILKLPLSAIYKKTLGRNFQLVTSFGTDLDINVSEVVKYHYSSNKQLNNENPPLVKRKMKPVLFNNFIASIGVEKNFRKLSVGISPFYSYQMSNVVYKLNSSSWGATLRLLYNI